MLDTTDATILSQLQADDLMAIARGEAEAAACSAALLPHKRLCSKATNCPGRHLLLLGGQDAHVLGEQRRTPVASRDRADVLAPPQGEHALLVCTFPAIAVDAGQPTCAAHECKPGHTGGFTPGHHCDCTPQR